MAKSAWTDGKKQSDAVPKKTSIGHGRRKRGSYSWHGKKKYRGQGK